MSKVNDRENLLKTLYISGYKIVQSGRLPSMIVMQSNIQPSERLLPLDIMMVYHFHMIASSSL